MGKHYLAYKNDFIDLIVKTTTAEKLTEIENSISKSYFKYIMEQIDCEWIAVNHCEELQKMCLHRRVDLLITRLYKDLEDLYF